MLVGHWQDIRDRMRVYVVPCNEAEGGVQFDIAVDDWEVAWASASLEGDRLALGTRNTLYIIEPGGKEWAARVAESSEWGWRHSEFSSDGQSLAVFHMPKMERGRLAIVDLEANLVTFTDIIWGGEWCVWEGESTIRISGRGGASQLLIDINDPEDPKVLETSPVSESDMIHDVVSEMVLFARVNDEELQWHLGEHVLETGIDGKAISLHGSYLMLDSGRFVWLDKQGEVRLLDLKSGEQSVVGQSGERAILHTCGENLNVFSEGAMTPVELP